MRFFILLFSITILSSSLFAERIMITKTSKKRNLQEINKILTKLHVKMYVKKSHSKYIVYTKNYSKNSEINYNLKKIKQYFPSAYIAHNANEKNEKKGLYNFFISGGVAKSFVSTDDVNITKTSGMSYSLEAGYYLTEYLYMSAIYEKTDTTDITLSNIYGSVNYNYELTENTNLYAGILMGYSTLELDVANATPSTSLAYGGQIGVSYDVLGFLPISMTYEALSLAHKIDYSPTLTTNFSVLQSLKFGLGFKF